MFRNTGKSPSHILYTLHCNINMKNEQGNINLIMAILLSLIFFFILHYYIYTLNILLISINSSKIRIFLISMTFI